MAPRKGTPPREGGPQSHGSRSERDSRVAEVGGFLLPRVGGGAVSAPAAVQTDGSGFYRLQVPVGTYTVTASRSGYADQSRRLTLRQGATPLNFPLQPLAAAKHGPTPTPKPPAPTATAAPTPAPVPTVTPQPGPTPPPPARGRRRVSRQVASQLPLYGNLIVLDNGVLDYGRPQDRVLIPAAIRWSLN